VGGRKQKHYKQSQTLTRKSGSAKAFGSIVEQNYANFDAAKCKVCDTAPNLGVSHPWSTYRQTDQLLPKPWKD
jgi:hypothetical protein